MDNFDVVIIGSGIGGLCCGSLLASRGKKVLICESHSQPGGVAHTFTRNGYKFESGPSLWNGLESISNTSPLGQILYLLESVNKSKTFIEKSLINSYKIGAGPGPLGHYQSY